MTMNQRTLTRYNEILRMITLRNGVLVSTDQSVYSWMDHDWDHAKRCELRSSQNAREITYDVFAGTFTDLDTKHAMEIGGVSCDCGKLQDRQIRWETTVAEALHAALVEVLDEISDS